jgi:ribonuclease PH
MTRPSGRKVNEIRDVDMQVGVNAYAEGSCLIKMGGTHVLCTASVENRVPHFMRGKGEGWVTAEYGMLPRSTHDRMDRESVRGKQSGRTQEIQRLIGRSLRSIVDLVALGERQIKVDCDVIQADGGTRTAAITGAYVALHQAINTLQKTHRLKGNPLTAGVVAVSAGLYKDQAVLDLDYAEDSDAQADANFVMTHGGQIIEIQGTAEKNPFTTDQFTELLTLAQNGSRALVKAQYKALGFPV